MIFLHGGGGDAASFAAFFSACRGKVLLICEQQSEKDLDVHRGILVKAGAQNKNLVPIVVTPQVPLTPAQIHAAAPDGLFVLGGHTPSIYEAIMPAAAAIRDFVVNGGHYAGTSAGASVAPDRAVIGGWRVQNGSAPLQIIFQGAAEGLDLLEVRPGLGLVPFGVDVHASQWGTLNRLVHAVRLRLVGTPAASIDENTALFYDETSRSGKVTGSGQVAFIDGHDAEAVLVRCSQRDVS